MFRASIDWRAAPERLLLAERLRRHRAVVPLYQRRPLHLPPHFIPNTSASPTCGRTICDCMAWPKPSSGSRPPGPKPFSPLSGWESASAPQHQCSATAQGEQPCRILQPSSTTCPTSGGGEVVLFYDCATEDKSRSLAKDTLLRLRIMTVSSRGQAVLHLHANSNQKDMDVIAKPLHRDCR